MVPPDKAAIIYGRTSRVIDPDTGVASLVGNRVVIKGKGTFRVPFIERHIFLDLSIHEITLSVKDILSRNGVRVNVEAVAVVKIADDEMSIRKAATQFGDMSKAENHKRFRDILEKTLQGHFRSIIGTLTPKELTYERHKFTQQVQQAAGAPLSTMGIEIISFTMQSVDDQEGYLDLLKKSNIAIKEKEENTKEATAKREEQDSVVQDRIQVLRLQEEEFVVKEQTESKVEQARIQKAKEMEVAEKERILLVKQREEEVRKKEHDIALLDAEYEKDKTETLAKARANEMLMLAEAEAEKIRLQSTAEAEAKKALANSYNDVDESSKFLLVLEKLPEIIEKLVGKEGLAAVFREIAQPLGNIESVRIYDFGGNTGGEGSPLSKYSEIAPKMFFKVLAQMSGMGMGQLLEKLGIENVDEMIEGVKKLAGEQDTTIISKADENLDDVEHTTDDE